MTDTIKWRDVIEVHPAAELFPQLPEDDLRALGDDIKVHGMKLPIVLWTAERCSSDRLDVGPAMLLDGRNRLDVMLVDGRNRLYASELAGVDVFDADGGLAQLPIMLFGHDDPHEYVLSANILRRHLTTAQKYELIAKLLRDKPERSDRHTAELTKVDHKTVGEVRKKLEAVGGIPQQKHTITKDGASRDPAGLIRW
jgi:hypothetical protein